MFHGKIEGRDEEPEGLGTGRLETTRASPSLLGRKAGAPCYDLPLVAETPSFTASF